jgi:trimeric autotransporter adhesin
VSFTTNALTRRAVLRTGAVAGAIASTGVEPSAASARALVRVRPAIADNLVDSFGIAVHVNHQKSVYGNHAMVADWLERLGVRHIRSRLALVPDVLDAFEHLAHKGIKIHATCGEFGDPQTMGEIMSTVRRRYAHPGRIFTAFEGINEPNNDGKLWIDETRKKTAGLHKARAQYGLRYIPIVAPALARVTSGGVQGNTTLEQARNLGDLSHLVDIGNMHVYPRGMQPSVDIAEFRRIARLVSGPGPVMCTEGGYFTAMGYHGGPNPVPEKVAAAYAPQHILEHWRAGTSRFFR